MGRLKRICLIAGLATTPVLVWHARPVVETPLVVDANEVIRMRSLKSRGSKLLKAGELSKNWFDLRKEYFFISPSTWEKYFHRSPLEFLELHQTDDDLQRRLSRDRVSLFLGVSIIDADGLRCWGLRLRKPPHFLWRFFTRPASIVDDTREEMPFRFVFPTANLEKCNPPKAMIVGACADYGKVWIGGKPRRAYGVSGRSSVLLSWHIEEPTSPPSKTKTKPQVAFPVGQSRVRPEQPPKQTIEAD
ncbi:MAG: hypothetical protein MHM6MM_005187 [Cercozoa sp. M6MM]